MQLRVLSSMLKTCGNLRFAISAADARRLMDEAIPDLLVLDAEMPGMSGLELLQSMRADARLARLPVVLLTAHREAVVEARALQLGASYLTKPVERERLLEVLDSLLADPQDAVDTRDTAEAPATEAKALAHVLVVSDSESLYDSTLRALDPVCDWIARCGAQREALQQCWAGNPDVVILGVGTRGIDEIGFIAAFQADPGLAHIPLILIDPLPNADHEARALEAGAADFLPLPFCARVLRARVTNLTKARRVSAADLQTLRERA
jgi:DNA-binding response OmpR family regulator